MKILVTGANGQLGTDVMRQLSHCGLEAKGVDLPQFDIANAAIVHQTVLEYWPDAVIHCAAYTQVDKAEQDAVRCYAVNVDGTSVLARTCAEIQAKLLYVSTDYVFGGDGTSPYQTEDAKHPVNTYGETKLLGEQEVQQHCRRHFIVRTSWLFGQYGNNFVKTILRKANGEEALSVVADQVGSPTYTADLAELLCTIIQSAAYGVYHASNEGFCSWAEFAAQILYISGSKAKIHPVTTAQYPAAARRPLNSRLSKDSLVQAGFPKLSSWQNALQRYLQRGG